MELADEVEDTRARDELLVQRLVVRSIRADQLVHVLGAEAAQLLREARAGADRCEQALVRDVLAQHRAGRVAHRGEDHGPRVDQRPVEIPEHDGEAHPLDASRAPTCERRAGRPVLPPRPPCAGSNR